MVMMMMVNRVTGGMVMMVKMVKVMKRRKGVNMKKCEHTLKDSPLDNFEVLLLLNFWDK